MHREDTVGTGSGITGSRRVFQRARSRTMRTKVRRPRAADEAPTFRELYERSFASLKIRANAKVPRVSARWMLNEKKTR